MTKEKRNAIIGIIFAVGFIVILVGGMTDLYEAKIGSLVGLAIWILGGAIVKYYFVVGSEETMTPPEQSNIEENSTPQA